MYTWAGFVFNFSVLTFETEKTASLSITYSVFSGEVDTVPVFLTHFC